MQPAISIINKSKLEEGRLDAEFYQPLFLKNKQSVDDTNNDTLGNLTSKIVVGFVSSMVSHYADSGVDLLQTRNVAEFFVKADEVIKIDLDFHQKLKKSQVKKGDILVARSGSFGNASLYLDDKIVNSADIIIVEADKNKINPYYLTAFLNSQKGKLQLYRFASGGLQGHVNTTILHNLKISKASDAIEEAIEELIKKSYEAKILSEKTLKDTNDLLLNDLGFDGFVPSKVNYSSRTYKDYLNSHRLDSEYWLPKYDQLFEVINKNQTTTLDQYFHKPIKGIEVGSDEYVEDGIPFVRVSDFSIFGIDENTDKKISPELYEKLKLQFKPQRGELLYTKDGTVGIAAVLDNDPEVILSGAFLRLKPKTNTDLHYLALLINSIICKIQIERLSGGALITHFKPEELAKIVVPVFDEGKQVGLGEKVREALALREQSRNLLEIAKHTVEIFVEEGEEKALSYIQEN